MIQKLGGRIAAIRPARVSICSIWGAGVRHAMRPTLTPRSGSTSGRSFFAVYG
jgi:hypothetical protein